MTTLHATRPRPTLGGFSTEFLALELRRLLRNRRIVSFALILPPVFYLVIALQGGNHAESYGNARGYAMVTSIIFNTLFNAANGGALVAVERGLGWSRQLRLTPLRPAAYIATKTIVAMVMPLAVLLSVSLVGALTGARLTAAAWVGSCLLAWACSLVFAAFGLFLGYLLPSESVMPLLGLLLAFLDFAGGLFFTMSGWVGVASKFVPTYGIASMARMPLGVESGGEIAAGAANIVVWGAFFIIGAMVLFRRDTARV